MTRQEKIAWFNLAVFAVILIVFCGGYIAITTYVPEFDFWRRVRIAFSAVGLCGLWGLSGRLFKKEKDTEILTDERDMLIQRRSVFLGHLVFWLFFVMISVGVWGVLFFQGIESIPIEFLPIMVFMGMLVVGVTQSVATLVLYRRGIDAGAEGE